MIWYLLAAGCFAGVVYAALVGPPLPGVARARKPARRARTPRPALWSVTRRSYAVLGWDPARMRMASVLAAVVVGLGWALLVQNLPAGVLMGWIGWQLPGFAAELAASRHLDLLQRQLSVFVGAVHDALMARGATPEDALIQACRGVHGGPLAPMALAFLQRTDANVSLPDRLRFLGDEVDLPHFRLFTDLMLLREETGAAQMAQAFRTLDDQLRDDEHLQSAVRGELGLYMLLLVFGLLADVVVFPAYRILSAHWPLVRAHLSFLITFAALGAAIVFSGVRRFARARVQLD